MGKIQFVLEEFFRSFQRKLWKNVIYMVIFSISILLIVIMGSYFFNIDGRYHNAITNTGEEGNWYGVSGDYIEGIAIWDNAVNSLEGCNNCLNYYKDFSKIDGHPTMAIATQQMLQIKENDLKQLFGENDFKSFVDPMTTTPVTTRIAGDTCAVYQLKGIEMDYTAWQEYGLNVMEGEGFSEENTTLRTVDETIPIVMGSDYKNTVEVGQRVDIGIAGTGYLFECEVVGFLEQGSTIPFNGLYQGEEILLNDRVVFPLGLRIQQYGNDLDKLKKYADLANTTLFHSLVLLTSENDVRNLTEKYAMLAKKYSLPGITLAGASMGIELLRHESRETIEIILVMTIMIVIYAFLGIAVSFYDKLQANKRNYGIYLSNGGSISLILVSFYLEWFIIVIPAFAFNFYFFQQNTFSMLIDTEKVLQIIVWVILIVYVIGGGILSIIFRNVDVEKLMRQRD